MDLSEKPSFWKALKPPAKDKCGELLTSLCYHPSNSILTLTLLKARNLKAKDINGKSGECNLNLYATGSLFVSWRCPENVVLAIQCSKIVNYLQRNNMQEEQLLCSSSCTSFYIVQFRNE